MRSTIMQSLTLIIFMALEKMAALKFLCHAGRPDGPTLTLLRLTFFMCIKKWTLNKCIIKQSPSYLHIRVHIIIMWVARIIINTILNHNVEIDWRKALMLILSSSGSIRRTRLKKKKNQSKWLTENKQQSKNKTGEWSTVQKTYDLDNFNLQQTYLQSCT